MYLQGHCGFHSISPSAFFYLDLKSSAKFKAEDFREKQKKAEEKTEALPQAAAPYPPLSPLPAIPAIPETGILKSHHFHLFP
jgi:hypothetical protein